MADIVNKAQTVVEVDGEKAIQQLTVLEQQAQKYKQALMDADKAGDVKAFRQAEKDLKGTNKQIRDIARSSFDLSKVMNNLSTSGMPNLRYALSAINKELNKPHIERGSKQYNALAQQARLVRQEMDKLNAELGVGQTKMNKYFGAAQVVIGNLATRAITFLSSAVVEGVDKIRSFEKANVVLAGILGTTKDKIKDLTSSAISLGKTSKYTASQVTELQTELARLGFDQNEIKQSQKYILMFATALDANLGDAASLAGAALRAFGEDTSETERYVSAMTMAANKSALGFESLATAMPIVAPIAKAFNFTVEDTLALLGNLSDSGFNASSSATALRNIFLNLADSNGKLAKELGRPVRNLDDLVEGFKKLKEQGIDLSEALELTDKLSVAAFQTLMQGADKLVPLRDSLKDTGAELERVANDQMNNLDGSILTLQSSWEALMLSFSNSSGVMKTLVDWTTDFVDGLTNIIDKTKLMQDKGNYNDILSDHYTAYRSSQDSIMNRLTSEGKSFDDIFTIWMNKSEAELSEKLKELESAKKKYDERQASKGFFYHSNPLNVLKYSENAEIDRAYEVAQYEYDKVLQQQKALSELKSNKEKKDLDKESTAARQSFIDMNQKQLKQWLDDEKNAADKFRSIANEIYKLRNGDENGNDKTTKISERERINLELRTIEIEHQDQLSAIKQKYLDNGFETEEAYNKALLDQQDKFDAAKKAKLLASQKMTTDPSLQIDLARQMADIEAKALDRQIADRQTKQKKAFEDEQALIKWNEEETQAIIRASFDHVALEEDKALIDLLERKKAQLITEAQFQKELTAIQIKHLEERMAIQGLSEGEIADIHRHILEEQIRVEEDLQNKRIAIYGRNEGAEFADKMEQINEVLLSGAVTFGEAVYLRVSATFDVLQNMVNSVTSYMQASNDVQIASINKRYDAEIKAAGRNQKKVAKLEEKRDEEIRKTKKEGNERSFNIQIAMAMASTAQSAVNAYSSTAAIPIIGPTLAPIAAGVAAAAGMLNVAAIKKQKEAASANYWTGGYTPRGYKYGYAGNVHFGEFVANQDTVNNPEANAMLRVIDLAQRNNTSSSLRAEDFARALEYKETVATLPTRAQNSSVVGYPVQQDDGMTVALHRVAQATEQLEERLQKEIVAKTYYKGEGGIENQIKKDQKLNKNISKNG